ncbi:MAG: DUF58 domain-containing protein [Coriobacteriia bacterium]|nr:DUF58 domain-containing protein [Coriobacteriia bacterium]
MPVKRLDRQARQAAHKARRQRQRKRALKAPQRHARRSAVLKAVACVVVLALFLALAIMVGDSDYRATLIGWAPFVAVVCAILFSFFYIRLLKPRLSFSEEADSTFCQRGEAVLFTVRFNNPTPLFVFQARAYFYVSDLFGNKASEDSVSLALGPFDENSLDLHLSFDHLGTYTAGLDRVEVKDFLGLFGYTWTNTSRKNVNVTPKIQLIEDLEFSSEAMLETTKAAKSALSDSMDYAHVRDYVPGDPLKTIHWKLSARSENYLTKLFEIYTNPGVGIILDFYSPSEQATELMGAFDAVVESGFSIAQYAQRKGMETELFFRNRYQENQRVTAWGQGDMPKLIDDMPRMSNEQELQDAAANILRDQITSQYGQNNIVMVSANIESRLVSLLVEAKLRKRAPMMVAVVPAGLDGRALDAYCAPLAQLDAADIPYMVLSRSDELVAMNV